MFENSNREMVREIARETMKVHRLRNVMACFAIALTTILITVLCGAGVSTLRAIMAELEMNPGPGTGGAGIEGDPDTLGRIRQQPEVEWADIARLCMEGTPRNKEFAGNEVKLLGVSDTYYGHHYVELISGEYPQNTEEILISDTMAEKIHMDMTPGQNITLNLLVLRDGKQSEEPLEVTVSGFYSNPLRQIEGYEEIYTVENFPDVYNPQMEDRGSRIYTKLAGVTRSTSEAELVERLEALNQKVGGRNIIYIHKNDYSLQAAGGIALLFLIVACGYFLIYNIFYISVVNDIRFMGSMKTIGMTGRQIRKMLGYQVLRLAAAGIALGVAVGLAVSVLAVDMLKNMEFTFAAFYEIDGMFFAGVAAAILFAGFTVWISSRKALSLAAGISPVEAARFRMDGKKKHVFAVISFALSGILFCASFSMMMGYDIEYMVNRMNESDFSVYQYHAGQSMEAAYEPMDGEFVRQLTKLPFAENTFTYYRARNVREDLSYNGMYLESAARVRYDGWIKETLDREFALEGGSAEEFCELNGDGIEMGILGMPAEALPVEAENLNLYCGSLDEETFAAGDYLIYQPFFGWGQDEDYAYEGAEPGGEVTLSFYNYAAQEYVQKTFTLMAVVGGKKDNYAGEITSPTQLIISDTAMREIYGSDADQMISSVHIDTDGGDAGEQLEILEQMVAENFNPQVHIRSRLATRQAQEIQKMQKNVLGILVGLIFGFIGMANIVNTLVTGVLSRKLEFAALQSIGMTKLQMAGNIFRDGMKLVLLSMLFMVPVGLAVSAAISAPPLSTGFVPELYAAAAAMVLAAGTLLSWAVAVILVKVLNKKSVVERLREAE